MKNNIILYSILTVSIILNLIILLQRNKEVSTKVEMTIKLDKKPVVNNYHFTNPTLLKEKTIEYRTTNEVLSRNDSDLIVKDYLKQRTYSDSLSNDTFKLKYLAIIEKNSLKDIDFKYSYRPLLIEKKITKESKAIIIGTFQGLNNNQIDLGLIGGIEFKKYSVGVLYQPITNKRGGFIFITRRIKYN